jgi:hypothetical protein
MSYIKSETTDKSFGTDASVIIVHSPKENWLIENMEMTKHA